MTRIAVSNNSLVDYSPDRWRLIQVDDPAAPQLIVEAVSGAPIRFNGYFAVSRDLPDSGEIMTRDLGQVVLGWSQESVSWQLGVTLSQEVSLARSSRWFEVLRFTSPNASLYEATAAQLGKALARTLDIPFIAQAPAAEPEPEPEPIPLEQLPLDLGMWRLQAGANEGELMLLRQKRWMQGKRRQLAWYALLVAIYTWVSLATLTSELGLPSAGTLISVVIPEPQALPILGLAVAALLLLATLRQLWLILREPDTLVINPYDKTINARRGDNTLWSLSASSAQSVYASEVVKKRGRRPTSYHGEINLHLLDGSFLPLLVDREKIVDGLLPGRDPVQEKERPAEVAALEPAAVSTPLQAAALHIAVSLGELPLWYDKRFR